MSILNLQNAETKIATGGAPRNFADADLATWPVPCDELRVLEVIPGNGQGTPFVFARRQVASLAAAGVNVRSFYLNRSSLLVLAREWMRLRREIRQFRPALVHAHFGSVTGFLCAVATTIPLVMTIEGSDLNHNPDSTVIHNWLAHLLSQIACVRAKRVITVSQQLRSRLWWRRDDAVVIPTGVNLNLFRPVAKEQARRILGWEQDAPTVVFHRGSRPRLKGAEFIEAAVRFAEGIIGRSIRLMAFDGEVQCDFVPHWINAADCVALASVSEGSPNVVKEALACNVPVVATDVGDVVERLRDVWPSRVVPRDVAEFGEALASTLRDRRLSNGRERVTAVSEPRIAVAVKAVYDEVIHRMRTV